MHYDLYIFNFLFIYNNIYSNIIPIFNMSEQFCNRSLKHWFNKKSIENYLMKNYNLIFRKDIFHFCYYCILMLTQ